MPNVQAESECSTRLVAPFAIIGIQKYRNIPEQKCCEKNIYNYIFARELLVLHFWLSVANS